MNEQNLSPNIEFYIPGGGDVDQAFARSTHLAIGAHQDDLEINMIDGILQCFSQQDRAFFGIVATDGRGSPRTGPFETLSDDEMVQIRRKEQREAADIGQYSGVAFLPWRSAEMKDPLNPGPLEDIFALLTRIKPQAVYTHNLMDKHDTHVAVALRTIEALRKLDPEDRPQKVYGCEGWRNLDWLVDSHKVLFDCSDHVDLQKALVQVFQSQIAGGKRYDLSSIGRRQAHATGQESHAVDSITGLSIGIDLRELMLDPDLDPMEWAVEEVRELENDVRARIAKLR